MSNDRQRLGARGETLAEEWLLERGYALVERNYRCRYGEIDRVMRHEETLAFVEVKTRRRGSHGTPAEAVTAFKRRQITHAAHHFLIHRPDTDRPCRFDVVEVFLTDGSPVVIRHYPGVFDAEF